MQAFHLSQTDSLLNTVKKTTTTNNNILMFSSVVCIQKTVTESTSDIQVMVTHSYFTHDYSEELSM